VTGVGHPLAKVPITRRFDTQFDVSFVLLSLANYTTFRVHVTYLSA